MENTELTVEGTPRARAEEQALIAGAGYEVA